MRTGKNRATEIYRNQGPMYGSFMLNYWMNWQVSAQDPVVISLGKLIVIEEPSKTSEKL